MILNLGSLAFNANIETSGGTPAWGTELGQGEGYKFAFEDMSDFFTGMVYKSVADIDKITCPLGKGGNQRADYDFVIASLFDKVFVNGKKVNDAQFLLLVVKKLNGDYHVGRRTIKYNPRMTYHGKYINEDCYKKMAAAMGLPEDAAWFVYEIFIKNQDELHFTAFELGKEPQSYRNNEERKKAFINRLPKDGKRLYTIATQSQYIPQLIYYGAPGTGKSHKVSEITEQQPKENVFRTTFHPDSDYSTFVGCYKPSMTKKPVRNVAGDVMKKGEREETEDVITYKFVAQTFTRAYLRAWQTEEPVFLVIEEINRGNCAQIFGDLFQLLDRKNGESEYPVDADTDLANYLSAELAKTGRENIPVEVKSGKKLLLPSNLYIWATMNTSDQSLFPIDSAFKRRWDWEYMPIGYKNTDWIIEIGNKKYEWVKFQREINDRIYGVDNSEDKQLGDYFVNADRTGNVISSDTLLNKILFYCWNDVCKDDPDQIFRWKDNKDNNQEKSIKFSEFFCEESEKIRRLQGFMACLGIKAIDAPQEATDSEINEVTTENGNEVNS